MAIPPEASKRGTPNSKLELPRVCGINRMPRPLPVMYAFGRKRPAIDYLLYKCYIPFRWPQVVIIPNPGSDNYGRHDQLAAVGLPVGRIYAVVRLSITYSISVTFRSVGRRWLLYQIQAATTMADTISSRLLVCLLVVSSGVSGTEKRQGWRDTCRLAISYRLCTSVHTATQLYSTVNVDVKITGVPRLANANEGHFLLSPTL